MHPSAEKVISNAKPVNGLKGAISEILARTFATAL
jgi:hypothetical protein